MPRSWPGGATVAVWPVINVESFPAGEGPAIQPHLSGDPEIANSGWRAYGNRAGLPRLAALFEELHLPASAAVNAVVARTMPAAVRSVRRSGWEVMGHGEDNSRGLSGLSEMDELAAIQGCAASLDQAFGKRPVGWLTPRFEVTRHTRCSLVRAGFTYTADLTDDDVPRVLATHAGSLVAIPYSLEVNDITLCLSARMTATDYADAIVAHVAELAREHGAGRPLVAALGLHTFIAGQPARTAALRRALGHLQTLPGVSFATGQALADHIITTAQMEVAT